MTPAADLVVARQAGEDREAGRIGGGPAGRAQPVRAEVPDRAGARSPSATLRVEREELVELAGVAVDDQCMAIAVRAIPAFDRHAAGNGVRAAVGLARVLERDPRLGCAPADDGDRDPDRSALPQARAEVRVQASLGADRADDRGRVRRDREPVDAAVPGIGLGKDRAARCGRHAQSLGRRAAQQHGETRKRQQAALHDSVIDRLSFSTKGSASPQRGGHSSRRTQRQR